MADTAVAKNFSGHLKRKKMFAKLLLYKRRRNLAAAIYFRSVVDISRSLIPMERSRWTKFRSQAFWYETVNNNWQKDDWITNFRMSSESFANICVELAPFVEKQSSNFREPIPVPLRVAVAVYFLCCSAEYRTISNLFGVGLSTVCTLIHEVCAAISLHLLPHYIQFPSVQEIPKIMNGFLDHSPFPQVIGAIDGCHVNIMQPNENGEDYINRHDVPSIILQAVVDDSYLFRDIFVGWSGKSHDSRVFKNSPLFQGLCKGLLKPEQNSTTINGVDVPPLILGDSAYPLQNWLLKPFSHASYLTPQQIHYNNCLSMSRVVVENAFGRLKARFRCIAKRLDLLLDNCLYAITACCILHNYCELSNQPFDERWLHDFQVDHFGMVSQAGSLRQDQNASAIRNAIVDYLFENAH